jgi:hypothetical protein
MSRTFFSLDWKEKIFPCFLAPVRETRRWVVPRIWHASISGASLLSSEDVDWFSETGKPWWLAWWQHIGLSEARGLVLFGVVREGIEVTRRLSAQVALHAYRPLGYSLSNPSASRTDPALPEQGSSEMERALTRDAQAACEFSLLMSKSSPFFHRVSVMAAILRASVRRTMVGLMPLASERW